MKLDLYLAYFKFYSIRSPIVLLTFAKNDLSISNFFILDITFDASNTIFCHSIDDLHKRWAKDKCWIASWFSPSKKAISQSKIWILQMLSEFPTTFAHFNDSFKYDFDKLTYPKSTMILAASSQKAYLLNG